MTTRAAQHLLSHLLHLNRSAVALSGGSGIGKTTLVKDVATALGLEYRPVELAFYQTEDLCGIPHRDGERTLWTRPFWFPVNGAGVLALEDFNRVSDPGVLNCLMGLLLERRLHCFPLPPEWRIAATMNYGKNFLTTMLDPAHVARLAILEVEPDIDSVIAWGDAHGANPLVLEFLRANLSYLYQEPASDGQGPWPNPRSWLGGVGSNLPEYAEHKDPAFVRHLVAAFVGEAASAAFVNWLHAPPPTCKELLEQPITARERFHFAHDEGLLIQRLAEFMDYLPKTGFRQAHWSNLKTFLALVPADMLAGFVVDMEKKHPRLVWTEELLKWKRAKTS